VVTAAAAAPFTLALPGMTPGQVGLLAGSYLLSGILFSCDLDLPSEPYYRWKRFRFIWWPYQKIVAHRAVWSHGLVIGPVLRIVYFALALYLMMLFGLFLVNLIQPIDPTGTSQETVLWIGDYLGRHREAALLVLIGFILGGASHSIADNISTGFKRWRRRHPLLRRFFDFD
jgi:uncharacterized metal-binding protein